MSKAENNKNNKSKIKSRVTEEINNEYFDPPADISVKYSSCNPESCEEQVNCFGTYNIQPTANTDNDFPAIAQGATAEMKKRSRKFFRGSGDPNIASDSSESECF